MEKEFTSREAAREKKLKELLLEEEIKGESRVQKAGTIVSLINLVLSIISGFMTDPIFKHWNAFLVLFLFFLYSAVIQILLKRKLYKPIFKYITSFVLISLLTILLLTYGFINQSWLYAVKTDILIVYYVIICLSGIYHRHGPPVFAGITAMINYIIIFLCAHFFGGVPFEFGSEQFTTSILTSDQLILNAGSFLIIGFAVSFLAKQLPALLRRSLDSEAEFEYLEKMKNAIEDTHRQKSNFFVNVAHESKTPLTLIQNYLEKYIHEKGIDENLVVVRDNVGKLLRDMVNFMDVEKLEKGTLVYDHTGILPVSEYLKTSIPLFKGFAESKNIDFTAEIEDNIYTKADGSAFDRVINNLVGNAVRYTPEGGAVTLSLTGGRDNFCFSITDTGFGIPADRIDHIFTPYYQLSHTKRNVQGIGMGLAIVKQIIDSLEGTISVESEPGKGSCFSVILKRHEGEGRLTEYMESNTGIISGGVSSAAVDVLTREGGNVILAVEDNRDLLRYLADILGNKYRVYVAENGRAALKRLETIPKPDLIISDIMMDEMDGRELYLSLAKNNTYRDIPFIFLTAKTAMEEEVVALSRGAVDFIHKPFNAEILQAKIYSIIQNRNLKQALFEKDKFATLGMLVGGISHEIFNPLSGITGPLANLERIIEKGNLENPEKAKKYLEKIDMNTGRIADLINNLRRLYRNESLEKSDIPVKEVTEFVLDILKDKIPRHIVCTINIEDSMSVLANRQAFVQILTNLIQNAMDAIPQAGENRGEITVTGSSSGGVGTIVVADNGCGMGEEIQKNMFNAFFTKKEVGKGTGLGLFIVKDLVLKMGWTIDFTSQIGKGSEFIITCP